MLWTAGLPTQWPLQADQLSSDHPPAGGEVGRPGRKARPPTVFNPTVPRPEFGCWKPVGHGG